MAGSKDPTRRDVPSLGQTRAFDTSTMSCFLCGVTRRAKIEMITRKPMGRVRYVCLADCRARQDRSRG
jgi:hypothetical protein